MVSIRQASVPARNHCAPACHAMAWKNVGSSGKKVAILVFGETFFTRSAASRKPSQVAGGSMECSVKKSLR